MKAAPILVLWAARLAFAPAGFGQAGRGGDSWENLRQLRPGQKIQVVQKNGNASTGPFISFSAESVSLQARHGNKKLERADVMRVSRRGGKRGRNALIGAAAGAGAGVAIGMGAGGCPKGGFGPCIGRGLAAAVVGATGAIVGGVIGAMVPGNSVIYRAAVP